MVKTMPEMFDSDICEGVLMVTPILYAGVGLEGQGWKFLRVKIVKRYFQLQAGSK